MNPRHRRLAALTVSAACLALGLSACGSGFSDGTPTQTAGQGSAPSDAMVSVLIGSSGDSETAAVKEAVQTWAKQNNAKAEVIVASDLVQQASQGFASGKPADVLYVSTESFTGWAKNGSLLAYGDELANKGDFYDGLKKAFTYEEKFFCAPKDFSTLALIINEKMWKDAGLSDADLPRTWDELESVAKKLTSGKRVGLAFGPEVQRVGAFMAQAGGGLVTDGRASANSAANVQALTFVKKMMGEGVAAFSSDLGAGWGGEAFGKGMAAMVIEGNWITGFMKNDFGKVAYKVAELPAGTQKGTLQFTNCWGIAADGDNVEGAKSLVGFLTAKEQQLAFSRAFGPMPSIKSAKEDWAADNPKQQAFVEGAEYAQNLPAMPGAADVIKEFNSELSQLKTKDPKAMLDGIQPLLEPVVAG